MLITTQRLCAIKSNLPDEQLNAEQYEAEQRYAPAEHAEQGAQQTGLAAVALLAVQLALPGLRQPVTQRAGLVIGQHTVQVGVDQLALASLEEDRHHIAGDGTMLLIRTLG